MSNFYSSSKTKNTQPWWFWILLAAFLVVASITAWMAFRMVRDAVISLAASFPEFQLQQEPDASPAIWDELQPFDVNAPLQGENAPPPQPWDGKSRVTVLLLGVDHRDWNPDDGPPRTDTIILATIDPQSETAGVLSIPRDLWVEIPGFGYSKINQAYFLGEANRLPEGGAGLAIDTVEAFLEIPISYYVVVDFNAFVSLIDEIGGVQIDIPYSIELDPLGDHNTTTVKPGVQTLSGDLALAYARARNTPGSDFDRIQRQQQIIFAVRDQVFRLEMISTLMQKAPTLYENVAQGVKTNLSLQQIVQLAWLSLQIPDENIHRKSIRPEHVYSTISPQGWSILQPIYEEIFALRDAVFDSQPASVPTVVAGMSLAQRTVEEKAIIEVLNGTFFAGLASRTAEFLEGKNLQVGEIGNADQIYAATTIIDYTGKPYTLSYLAQLLNVPQNKIYHRYDPDKEADIVVLLGEDWAANNEMP